MPSQVVNIFNVAQRLTLTERLILAKLLLESVLGVEETIAYLQALQDDRESTPAGDINSDWPPDFFEATAGAWAGEPMVREPQDDHKVRDELHPRIQPRS